MFSKKDLDSGNVVELRGGDFYVLVNVYNESMLIALTGKYHFNFDTYYEDLTHKWGFETLDIVKVYKDYTCKELLWERKKKPELTGVEKTILKNYLSKGYKWIARDKEDYLYVYINKPLTMSNTLWISPYAYSYGCDITFERLFQFIKREDNEPYSIEELLEE